MLAFVSHWSGLKKRNSNERVKGALLFVFLSMKLSNHDWKQKEDRFIFKLDVVLKLSIFLALAICTGFSFCFAPVNLDRPPAGKNRSLLEVALDDWKTGPMPVAVLEAARASSTREAVDAVLSGEDVKQKGVVDIGAYNGCVRRSNSIHIWEERKHKNRI